MRWLDGITSSTDMNLGELLEMVGRLGVLQSTGSQRVGYDLASEQQQQGGYNDACLSISRI